MERAAARIGGRVAVGVCPGMPGTETTIELARHAESCGADYLLVPIPFYFANTLAGIVGRSPRTNRDTSTPQIGKVLLSSVAWPAGMRESA